MIARASRDVQALAKGKTNWYEGNGRKKGIKISADKSCHATLIKEWRAKNPDSKNKSLCARRQDSQDQLLPGGGILPSRNH